ncbi:MAG: GWxTD domain-containing protein [Ignavibacteriales bacterium]|nr:MAG: GWxTD domain-containing protein [Ignavibacteriales bacterium]
MNKIIPVLCFILSVLSFSQPKYSQKNEGDNPFPKLIYTKTLIYPGDSLSTIYFFYKVPYQNLVFLKNGGSYYGELRIDIEVTDSNSIFVKREIKDWKLNAVSYDQANSSEFFSEGFVSLNLPAGVYFIQPIITDQNSKREFKLIGERLEIKKIINFEPVIVSSKKFACEDEEFYKLTNFEGNVLFNSDKQSIIIPVRDNTLNEINVTILSRGDTIGSEALNKSFISSIGFKECSGKILINDSNDISTKNFILDDITGKLKEGPFTLIINDDEENKFHSIVFWYNKPHSLFFPEVAISALKHIEKETVIDSLLDLDDDLQYDGLVDYWKRMDPSPGTEYNELMNEFYTRVDYAQDNFTSLTGIKGIETDRGKIFIKFGKPDQVERSSNEKGKIIETWIYNNPQRKFIFVDKQGVGEFSLESS